MLEKTVEATLLYDYYGSLLTDKQRTIMELRFVEDLSLAEIADQVAVSRQAVHDTISRTILQLHDYETRLGLVANDQERNRRIEELEQCLCGNGWLNEEVLGLIAGLKQ